MQILQSIQVICLFFKAKTYEINKVSFWFYLAFQKHTIFLIKQKTLLYILQIATNTYEMNYIWPDRSKI